MSRKVIIIGATSGIGRALAGLYATNGDKVGVSGRRAELLQSLQEEFPGNIYTECFDVTGTLNVFHVRNLIEKLGGLDMLIYNSGSGNISKELDWDTERDTTAVNVTGFLEIVCYGFNYFVKQGYGHVVSVSSIAAIRGNAVAPAYSASKAFISTYMEGLYIRAYKLGKDIIITDVQPGFVDTKAAKGNKRFWVANVGKAAKQIYYGIEKKKRKVFITKRWRLIALILKFVTVRLYRRIGEL